MFMGMKLYIIRNYKNAIPGKSGSMLTEALVRKCAGDGCPEIARTEKEKPYFLNPPEGEKKCFSVSHSKDIFACIFAPSEVGIDIQHARNVDADRIAERYFSDDESALIHEDRNEFFRIWTRKEAYAKYTGDGISQVIDKTDVLNRKDVVFRDMLIDDPDSGLECFCAICVGAEEGAMLDEIQISY